MQKLHYTTLYHTIPHCTQSHYATQHNTTLHYTSLGDSRALRNTTLQERYQSRCRRAALISTCKLLGSAFCEDPSPLGGESLGSELCCRLSLLSPLLTMRLGPLSTNPLMLPLLLLPAALPILALPPLPPVLLLATSCWMMTSFSESI
jgi:hypothetical protein